MAEHTGGRWSPLLKSKMQIEATVISSPPSRPYPHLVLPSLPKCGHCLSKSDLPPQQQGGPTPRSRALSLFLRDCRHNQSGAHRPCSTSLRLMQPSRLSPPPWSWSRRRRVSCLSCPLLEFDRSLSRPPRPQPPPIHPEEALIYTNA